jgi:hypothetical protein
MTIDTPPSMSPAPCPVPGCGAVLARPPLVEHHLRSIHRIVQWVDPCADPSYLPEGLDDTVQPSERERDDLELLARKKTDFAAAFEADPSLIPGKLPAPRGATGAGHTKQSIEETIHRMGKAAAIDYYAGAAAVHYVGHEPLGLYRRRAELERWKGEHQLAHRTIVHMGSRDGSIQVQTFGVSAEAHASLHSKLGLGGPPDNNWRNWRDHSHGFRGAISWDPVPAPSKTGEAELHEKVAKLTAEMAALKGAKSGA